MTVVDILLYSAAACSSMRWRDMIRKAVDGLESHPAFSERCDATRLRRRAAGQPVLTEMKPRRMR